MRNIYIVILLNVIILLLCINKSYEYDTGHHFDLTMNAMSQRGFHREAIEITQLQNWIVDWNSQTPDSASMAMFKNFKKLKGLSERLHFDSLYNKELITNYWYQFYQNCKRIVMAIVTEREDLAGTPSAFLLISFLGFAMHAIQDFYTHSTWIESLGTPTDSLSNKDIIEKMNRKDKRGRPIPMCNNYAEIFIPFSKYNAELKPKSSLFTGYSGADGKFFAKHPDKKPKGAQPHGGYLDGVNKDSYFKRDFIQGYIDAFFQTLSFIDTIHLWVQKYGNKYGKEKGDKLWAEAQQLTISRAKPVNFRYFQMGKRMAKQISLYVSKPNALDEVDGHWKGFGSGDKSKFGTKSARFISSRFQRRSIFQQAVFRTNIIKELAKDLENEKLKNIKISPRFDGDKFGIVRTDPLFFRVLDIRTFSASASKVFKGEGLYPVIEIETFERDGIRAFSKKWTQTFEENHMFRSVKSTRNLHKNIESDVEDGFSLHAFWRTSKIVDVRKNPVVKVHYHLRVDDEKEWLNLNADPKNPSEDNKWQGIVHALARQSKSFVKNAYRKLKRVFTGTEGKENRHTVTFDVDMNTGAVRGLGVGPNFYLKGDGKANNGAVKFTVAVLHLCTKYKGKRPYDEVKWKPPTTVTGPPTWPFLGALKKRLRKKISHTNIIVKNKARSTLHKIKNIFNKK